MVKKNKTDKSETMQSFGITSIHVKGFKSICNKTNIEIKPLTILAGANSSGKSSVIQPLLLMKQSLEKTVDPGPLLLNGQNVKFTSMDQLLSIIKNGLCDDTFTVGVNVENALTVTSNFKKNKKGFDISSTEYVVGEDKFELCQGMKHNEILSIIPDKLKQIPRSLAGYKSAWAVDRDRCFLVLNLEFKKQISFPSLILSPAPSVSHLLQEIIHIPGFRGTPERSYPTTAVGMNFPGTFEKYVASVVNEWQAESNYNLKKLGTYLRYLGLTWRVEAKPLDDTQVELRVGRLHRPVKSRKDDFVNIADVGFGVSQVLPVLVALLVARKGQLVYIEQPELHLHPLAQRKLAKILADAAKRGVKVVVETHSSLLLRGIQTLVAKGSLKPELIKLHWFKRKKDGTTKITSADLDENGAFGDWPSDFDDVGLETEKEYLDAAESRAFAK